MPRLHSSRHIIGVPEARGFRFVSQKGSHVKYRRDASTVIVLHSKPEIPMGAFFSIVRLRGLQRTDSD